MTKSSQSQFASLQNGVHVFVARRIARDCQFGNRRVSIWCDLYACLCLCPDLAMLQAEHWNFVLLDCLSRFGNFIAAEVVFG